MAFSSCKSSKRVASKPKTTKTRTKPLPSKIVRIIDNAEAYKGVRYKYGGDSKKGMDCSGLVHTAFKEENIELSRTTSQLSKEGNWIDIKKVKAGDLVFFATRKNSRKINHVGLVVDTNPIRFIHASTSKGVIISSIKERYWYLAYVQARRVL